MTTHTRIAAFCAAGHEGTSTPADRHDEAWLRNDFDKTGCGLIGCTAPFGEARTVIIESRRGRRHRTTKPLPAADPALAVHSGRAAFDSDQPADTDRDLATGSTA